MNRNKTTDTNQASEVKRNSLNKSDTDVKLERIESDEVRHKAHY